MSPLVEVEEESDIVTVRTLLTAAPFFRTDGDLISPENFSDTAGDANSAGIMAMKVQPERAPSVIALLARGISPVFTSRAHEGFLQ